mmetsp:Transcript_1462/g.2400  ORF Transcript_1462/g.2400 Transcript_1462/m.2400 type:complete len:233 (-) Transcript_1462:407-1105(-)
MIASEMEATVLHEWTSLCTKLHLSEEIFHKAWSVICSHYGEETRHYHTLNHLHDMFKLAAEYKEKLLDEDAVKLAIFFHDAVYVAQSKTNEEDSAQLFHDLLSSSLNNTLVEKVFKYIIETKEHAVAGCNDTDLQFFIDFDMAILGTARAQYGVYAHQIRQEYAHIERSQYCTGRAAILDSFLKSSSDAASASSIFATPEFRHLYEAQARDNIAWECEILRTGQLVNEDDAR